ncbi:MAG: Ig-like domain-containing protein, partial [Oscillospiraceae bacterium]|nr:Ig-like domain-containing protein [Oscillospiraceae bacterium]
MALLLAAALVAVLLPVGVRAAAPAPAGKMVMGFEPLADSVKTQFVNFGTALEELALPETLRAFLLGDDGSAEAGTIGGVTWHSRPEYDGGECVTYSFTPELPEGYVLADGVALPLIRVDVFVFIRASSEEIVASAAVGNVEDADELQAIADSTGSGDAILAEDIDIKNKQLTISRSMTLDLNGKNLTITSQFNGIKIASGVTLTIQDSSEEGEGTLTVTNERTTAADNNGAAINTSSGTLKIEGGTIKAIGAAGGAGIGGGSGENGGTLIITGGTVVSQGAPNAAGIGGGRGGYSGSIQISGGHVTSTGGGGGAGIGGGWSAEGGNGSTVTITGGVVTATGGQAGAGIGGGYNTGAPSGTGSTINISGGIITAQRGAPYMGQPQDIGSAVGTAVGATAITGGSILADSIDGADFARRRVDVTVTWRGDPIDGAVVTVGSYTARTSHNDANGKVHIWLPAGLAEIDVVKTFSEEGWANAEKNEKVTITAGPGPQAVAIQIGVSVTGVEIDEEEEITLTVGDDIQLGINISPANADNRAVTWSSSNPAAATVEDGLVTAVSEGTATITVTTKDGDFEDSCEVIVSDGPGGGNGGGCDCEDCEENCECDEECDCDCCEGPGGGNGGGCDCEDCEENCECGEECDCDCCEGPGGGNGGGCDCEDCEENCGGGE